MIPKTPLLKKLRLRWKCLKHCLLFASSHSLFARGKATPWSNPQLIWGCCVLSFGLRESYQESACVPLEQKLPGNTSLISFSKQLRHSDVEDATGLLLRTSVGWLWAEVPACAALPKSGRHRSSFSRCCQLRVGRKMAAWLLRFTELFVFLWGCWI